VNSVVFYSIFVLKEVHMLTACEGYYENGTTVHKEEAPVNTKTDVIVTFLTADRISTIGKRIPGGLKGRISIPDDFDEPLDDLKDYS
jgi:hypothetical protein